MSNHEVMERLLRLTEENTRYKVALDLLEDLVKKSGKEINTAAVDRILGVARREIHLIEFGD